MRLLLAENDVDYAAFLARGLGEQGHDVRIARDGRDALFLLTDERFDAAIVDRDLAIVDGLELIRRLRNLRHSIPIVMLSAAGAVADKVEGLNAGADDFVVKPVAIAELDARLNALARRPARIDHKILRTRTIAIDLVGHSATRGGVPLDLTAFEYRILVALVENAEKVLTRPMLLQRVWGRDTEPKANIVAASVARLRAKLNRGGAGDAITTVHGVGYTILNDV